MTANDKKKLGLLSTVLLGINGIIGSGIFLLPGQIVHLTGSWSIFVYLFAAIMVLAIAWCFAQCAMLFHRNGGAYVYAKEAFGHFTGFQVGLMRWVAGMIAWAAIVVGFITALGAVWPACMQQPFRSILAITIISILGAVNILGIHLIKSLNNIITIAKILPLLFFILIGVFYMEQSHFALSVCPDFPIETFGGASLLIFYAFTGFEALVVAAEEIKHPRKTIPIAIMLVIFFCSALYFFIQMIATGILGPALSQSATPVADAAEKLFGSFGKWFVTIAMLISIGGLSVAASFVTPRSLAALADDRMISPILGVKGKFGTPLFAIAITVVLTAILSLAGNFAQLATISVIARFVQYIATCLAVLVFQRTHLPKKSLQQRTWRIMIPLFALSGLLWLLTQATSSQLYWGLGFLGLGIPFYFLQKRHRLETLTH